MAKESIELTALKITSRLGVALLAYFMLRIMNQIDQSFIDVDRSIHEISARGESRDKTLAEFMLEIEHRLTVLEAKNAKGT